MAKACAQIVLWVAVVLGCCGGLVRATSNSTVKPLCTTSCPAGTYEWDAASIEAYFLGVRGNFPHLTEKTFQRFEAMASKMLKKQSGGSGKYCFGRTENRRLTRLSTLMLTPPTGTTVRTSSTLRQAVAEVPGSCVVGEVMSSQCCPKTWNFNDGSDNNLDHMQAASRHTAQCRFGASTCPSMIMLYGVDPSYAYACACARRGCYIDALVDDISGSCQDADDSHPTFNGCVGDVWYASNSQYSAQCGPIVTGMCQT
eukprot:CAMPEP_0185844938 /NCGR_PEP_ID=MMETSP1354-20130828/1027_1 /TAXON_ID=708628 /ORGANISM="Erythrolobus madagascarensis, Strain CCMP3276" /LENGTH=255 /DNA_ID=CAMNT_0028544773 /DNA_START=149 /DNA_END=916 /DNA_ORIENTATION=+